MTLQRLFLLPLVLVSLNSYAMKALTNDEIRQEIIKGALKTYESGVCPSDYIQHQESPVQVSKSTGQSSQSATENVIKEEQKSGTSGSLFTFGVPNNPYWNIIGNSQSGSSSQSNVSQSQGGSTSSSENYTQFPGVCTCPCPYSKDIKGKECGNQSVYFQYQDGDPNKIPCYPEDIQDWQITDYRQQFDIPIPGQEQPRETKEQPNE